MEKVYSLESNVEVGSMVDNGSLYPAFVARINETLVKSYIGDAPMKGFHYFPIASIEASEDTVGIKFFLNPHASPDSRLAIFMEVGYGTIATLLHTSQVSFSQIPIAFVSDDFVPQIGSGGILTTSDVLFTVGPPAVMSPEYEKLIEEFQDESKLTAGLGNNEHDSDMVFRVGDLEAISTFFAYAHKLSIGDVSTLQYLDSQSDLINNARAICESTEDEELADEARTFAHIGDAVYKAYMHSLSASMFVDDEHAMDAERDAGFMDVMSDSKSEMESLLQSVIDLNDESVPVELRQSKLLANEDLTLLEDQDVPVMQPVVDALKKFSDYDSYVDIFTMDLTQKEVYEHAIVEHGITRVSIALLLMLAHRSVKFSMFQRTLPQSTLQRVPLYNLLSWFDITQASVSWQWLALLKPLRYYDMGLSKELMMFEQTVIKGMDIQEGAVAMPRNMINLMTCALENVIIWGEDYDFTNFATDALSLNLHLEGIEDFAEWFDDVVDILNQMREDMDDDNEAIEMTIKTVISNDIGNLDVLARRASLMLPLLSELNPDTTKFEVGSEEWSHSRKMFLLKNLLDLAEAGDGL